MGVMMMYRTNPHSSWVFLTKIYQADKHVPCNPSNGIRLGMYRYNECCREGMEMYKRQREGLHLPRPEQGT